MTQNSVDDEIYDCEGKYTFIDGCNVLHKLISIDKICFSKSIPILRKVLKGLLHFCSKGIIPCFVFDGYRSSDETVKNFNQEGKKKF